MNIAAMRVRVTFQKNTVIVDKYGNHKTGWADYFSCWATVGTSSGSESYGVVINPEESLDFTCRYCSELADVESTKYRIIAEGRQDPRTLLQHLQREGIPALGAIEDDRADMVFDESLDLGAHALFIPLLVSADGTGSA